MNKVNNLEQPTQVGRSLAEWGYKIDEWCERKGWNQNLVLGNLVANLHSEISEAWEEIRNGHSVTEVYTNTPDDPSTAGIMAKPEGFGIELADLLIRVLHITAHYGIDIERLMELKQNYNETRPFRHGGKTA